MDSALYGEMASCETTYWWFVAKRRIILTLLDRFIPAPAGAAARPRVCDIGCGCGALLRSLAGRYDAIGLDASAEARSHCAARGLCAIDGRLPDRLPLGPSSLDAVVLSDVLEHVDADGESVAAA